jgi:hypothetical protein
MVFINPSDASQSNSQIHSLTQTTIEAIIELLKLLATEKEDLQLQKDREIEKSEPAIANHDFDRMSQEFDQGIMDDWWTRYQSVPDISSPVASSDLVSIRGNFLNSGEPDFANLPHSPINPPLLTGGEQSNLSVNDFRQQIMAAVSVALVEKLGVNGKYEAEDYSIESTYVQDVNIYEISNREGDHIASFVFDRNNHPPANFIHDLTSIDDQIQFTETAYETVSVDVADLTGDRGGYLASVDTLGDLAPAGSRGVVLVENALTVTGTTDFKGNDYSFHKDAKGDVTISNNHTNSPILHTHKGQISSQALTPTDLAKFKQVYREMEGSTLIQAGSKMRSASPTRSASNMEIG